MLIDNVTKFLGEDIKKELKTNCENIKINICASDFSIYAFSKLKEELLKIDKFKFLYNKPTFLTGKELNKQRKEFYIIPSHVREKSIAGNEYEIKLRNELSQKAIAQECKKWIEDKCEFKTIIKEEEETNNLISIEKDNFKIIYEGVKKFSLDGLGFEKDSKKIKKFYNKIEEEDSKKQYLNQFDEIWKEKNLVKDVKKEVLKYIELVHKENSPEYLYFITLYNIFNEFLEEQNEDEQLNEKTGFKKSRIWDILYNFQKDGVLGGINKIEKFNGCIIADSVGLGKTYTALGIIKYFEIRNKNVLVLCPKRLSENWNGFKNNYESNPIKEDKLRYDVLFHTDLTRKKGMSNGLDLSKIMLENYDLIVIDESHNFRNNHANKTRQTRYQILLEEVIKKGVKTKLLMLSATPVNTKFDDLKNQLALAYEGDTKNINEKLELKKDLKNIFTEAQNTFKSWSRLEIENRTTKKLLHNLSIDFFKI
jgi:SNF2 family DNA or RNA helicase